MTRKYGFFRCPDCNGHWESSHVYTKGGNNTEFHKQECKKCKIACAPYRVEPIKCAMCGQTTCRCSRETRDARHTDPNKPHRRDLCLKCRNGNPCQ